ncbi:uncharacterized protein LOC119976547 [Scyliorhinus canicula]|uniref:uncharacterized protein LOC119976547 n=1 Tax=Scyliorhinus canicula TaxID=7830 RepID=UPI0018F44552|nr:uncharacterized protein LOC119976547 [Scyliorhinus canicula]XP_038673060.1 uncharacterized protein LOC119976547 [Scyliorhinus canicula]
MKLLFLLVILASTLLCVTARNQRCRPGGRILHLCREDTFSCANSITDETLWTATPVDTCTTIIHQDEQKPRFLTTRGSLTCNRYACRWDYRRRGESKPRVPECKTSHTHPPTRRKRAMHHVTANSFLFMTYGVKRLRQSSSDDWWGWLWSSSWTTYLFHGFLIFIVVCILLCIIATCVKCFCNCLGASVMPQMLQRLSQLDKQDLVDAGNVCEDVGLKDDFPEEFLRLSRINP